MPLLLELHLANAKCLKLFFASFILHFNSINFSKNSRRKLKFVLSPDVTFFTIESKNSTLPKSWMPLPTTLGAAITGVLLCLQNDIDSKIICVSNQISAVVATNVICAAMRNALWLRTRRRAVIVAQHEPLPFAQGAVICKVYSRAVSCGGISSGN